MEAKPSIDELWRRLTSLEGSEFTTKRGLPFTFTITDSSLVTSRTDYPLTRGEFEKALEMWPLDGPGEMNELVRGPAYIWAILNDRRVISRD